MQRGLFALGGHGTVALSNGWVSLIPQPGLTSPPAGKASDHLLDRQMSLDSYISGLSPETIGKRAVPLSERELYLR